MSANKKQFLEKVKHKPIQQKGFSLIELLVAMSIFSFAFLAIIKMQIQAYSVLSDAQVRSQAINFIISQKEIQYLEDNQKNISVMKGEWEEKLKIQLPQARVYYLESLNGQQSVTLYWASQNTYQHCELEKQDCLNT